MQKQKQKARDLKKETVGNLSEKIAKSKTIAFADYHGLTAQQLSQLREKIKEAGGELLVTKNTLLSRALTANHLPVTSHQLTGPTASLFAYSDEIAPIKAAAESAKALGTPKFKFGFFGKELLDAAGLDALAKIPGREILQGRVVGAIASPIYGIVSVLQANLRNLISVLDQKARKSQSG
ncbi:50S ribosomal protein L10 [Candidatus Curtissbacteria bacterium RBG_13_40_7]|uniref:Large ribosomal subunit protein uL10 n=1 Tax=Candidatus Curtissbacteria bacterium RBG_13_40_7 TaxID=1797706 RepID=A0A1F5FX08_9BACT|nr:MAG: 50S ribosomal protein L10 [Candidatus Curtissbacteria bacterium RBG_13_40_7]